LGTGPGSCEVSLKCHRPVHCNPVSTSICTQFIPSKGSPASGVCARPQTCWRIEASGPSKSSSSFAGPGVIPVLRPRRAGLNANTKRQAKGVVDQNSHFTAVRIGLGWEELITVPSMDGILPNVSKSILHAAAPPGSGRHQLGLLHGAGRRVMLDPSVIIVWEWDDVL
jgi:hypothetical protein